MDDPHDRAYAREPQIEDLARICRALNETGARYVLIGGFAVIAHGGVRTKDIDLLIDASPANVALVKLALRGCPLHPAPYQVVGDDSAHPGAADEPLPVARRRDLEQGFARAAASAQSEVSFR